MVERRRPRQHEAAVAPGRAARDAASVDANYPVAEAPQLEHGAEARAAKADDAHVRLLDAL